MRRVPVVKLLLAVALLGAGPASFAQHKDAPRAAPPQDSPRQYTFSWQFKPGDEMRPRGGTTKGAPITLATEPSEAWRAIQAPGIDKFERDRRAILAMAGAYRTTFDFIETVGFKPGFQPSRPYQSWGTEYIYVIEDSGRLIRLQHLIVMFVADAAGKCRARSCRSTGDRTGGTRTATCTSTPDATSGAAIDATPPSVRGRWTQAVFQVDDSPRYEAVGDWVHEGSYSAWTSETTWRPLPRREESCAATTKCSRAPTGTRSRRRAGCRKKTT